MCLRRFTLEPEQRNLLIGYSCGVLTIVFEAISLVCVQQLRGSVRPFQLNVWRYGFQLVFFCCSWPLTRLRPNISMPEVPWVSLLGIFSSIAGATFFGSVHMLPLGAHGTCYNAALMIGVAVLTKLFLTTPLSNMHIGGIILGTTGTFLVLQPEPFFHHHSNTTNLTEILSNSSREIPGVSHDGSVMTGFTLVIISAFSTALLYIVHVKLPDIDTIGQVFWQATLSLPISVAFMFYLEEPKFLPTEHRLLGFLLGYGLTVTLYNACMIATVRHLSPMFMALLECPYTALLFSLQYTLLRDINPGHGNTAEIVGAIVCLVAIGIQPVFDIYKLKSSTTDWTEPFGNY